MKYKKIISLFFQIIFVIFIYIYRNSTNVNANYFNSRIFSPYFIIGRNKIYISIIIPIYNRLIYLNDTLNSAISQTISISNGIEIICVDDCSNEKTSQIILSQMKQHPRIKFIQHYYNQGTFQSRKNGIYFSSGKYIISLDSDDFFYPNSIEQLYQFTLKFDADVIDFVSQAGKRRKLYSLDWSPCSKNFTNNSEIRTNFMNGTFGVYIWKLMIKRSIFIKALNYLSPFFENKKILYAEDVAFIGGVLFFSSNFYCTKFRVYIHYMFTYYSVEKGAVQPKIQNRYQLLFVNNLMEYLYDEKNKNSKSLNLKDMLSKGPNRTVIYNQLYNISRKIRKRCNFDCFEFIIINNVKKGFCTVIKRVNVI